MMRSGTSAVAAILNALGVYLGEPDRLLAPHPVNPTGFWEHKGIILLNDALLEHHGGSWYAPPPLPSGWDAAPELSELREGAAAILRELASGGIWGWKDPRTCLTLPFWERLAPDLVYVICLRNPVEVARSLAAMPWVQRQMDDPLVQGLDLWLDYSTRTLAQTAGRSRTLIFYDDLLARPAEAIARMAGLVGLTARLERKDVSRSLDQLVQPSLRHQVAAEVRGEEAEAGHAAHALFAALRSAGSA